jgi:hypothetical protein
MGRPAGTKNKAKPVTTDDINPFEAVSPEGKPRPISVDQFAEMMDDEEEGGFLNIPPELIPDGMRYEWKTFSVLGMQQSRRFGRFQARGWEPVPAARHPGMFHPMGYDGYIEYDGLVLCERPERMCQMVEEKEFQKARGQVAGKEAQLRGGDIEGIGFDTKHRSALRANRVSKSYEAFRVPTDDE